MHMTGHSPPWLMGWSTAPVHCTPGYGPQSLEGRPAHLESSSLVTCEHWKLAEHAPSLRVPWQVICESQVGVTS
jgi:hypothetical protein